MKEITVLAIDASAKFDTLGRNRRNRGRLTKLLNQALGAADAEGELNNIDVQTDIVHLHEVLEGFYQGGYEQVPDWIHGVFEKMIEADAIIFGTPVNWYSRNDYMQSFIQQMTAVGDITRQLAGKTAGIITTCEEDGGALTAATLALPLVDMSMTVPGNCMFYQNKHAMHRSEGKWQMTDHCLVGENVLRHAARMKGYKVDLNNFELRVSPLK
jgi:multimeric flavodoxin WrbA